MDYISKEKLEELKLELERLKTGMRKEIAKRLEEAKELGDLSENSEYVSAREAQERNERRINNLENIIKTAFIIKKPLGKGHVEIGSIIEINNDGKKETFKLVGSQESNPNNGEISNESPLGTALLDHKAGDTVEVRTPKGIRMVKIVSIK